MLFYANIYTLTEGELDGFSLRTLAVNLIRRCLAKNSNDFNRTHRLMI